MVNDSLTTLVQTLGVGIVAYVALILLLRISGKRTLSKWNAFDFVVTVALGSSLATTLLSGSTTLAQGVVAVGLLILLQFAITWLSVRSGTVRKWVKAEPTLLLYQGQFEAEALRRERVTEAEVRAALRGQGIANTEQVGAVVLETDGSFSVIRQLSDSAHSTLADVAGARDQDHRQAAAESSGSRLTN